VFGKLLTRHDVSSRIIVLGCHVWGFLSEALLGVNVCIERSYIRMCVAHLSIPIEWPLTEEVLAGSKRLGFIVILLESKCQAVYCRDQRSDLYRDGLVCVGRALGRMHSEKHANLTNGVYSKLSCTWAWIQRWQWQGLGCFISDSNRIADLEPNYQATQILCMQRNEAQRTLEQYSGEKNKEGWHLTNPLTEGNGLGKHSDTWLAKVNR